MTKEKYNDTSPSKSIILAGKIINRIGHLALPLGVGVAIGFYTADQEIRWLPTVLGSIFILFVFGFGSLVVGRAMQGKAFHENKEKKGMRKRIVISLTLACICIAIRMLVFWMESPSPLTGLSPDKFNDAFEIDRNVYRELNHGMKNVLAFVESNSSKGMLSAEEEKELLLAWTTIYEHAFALDQIRIFYEDWYRFDPSRAQRAYLLRSFLLTFAAELALYENSTRVVSAITKNPNAVKFLNAPHPDHQLPADAFSLFREQFQGMRDQARIVAGEKYLQLIEKTLNAKQECASLGLTDLWNQVENHLHSIKNISTFKKNALTMGSDLELIKRQIRRNWYPAQKAIAQWMGDARVRRIGEYLITEQQQEQINKKLEPGDILLARKNWYLSNVGLPGFWPHAILYIGNPQKFEKYFDTPVIRQYVKEISGKELSLGQYLALSMPADWAEYHRGDGEHEHLLIEAISEGVVFNSLGHTAGDYLAAMRPRLSKKAKAQAIIEAFGHLGKPYDFDFDFATDHALVCTELVWRSYRPAPGKEGLQIPLVKVMGRNTLPANEIATLFAKEDTTPNKQLDFVLFFDATEKETRAFESTENEFAQTHERTKWDVALP